MTQIVTGPAEWRFHPHRPIPCAARPVVSRGERVKMVSIHERRGHVTTPTGAATSWPWLDCRELVWPDVRNDETF
jgi:hypothetical protein